MLNIKTNEIGIDIGESYVRVVKTNATGIITGLGEAELPMNWELSNKRESIEDLAKAMNRACKEARVWKSASCVLITGGPRVIIRNFEWPKMPYESLRLTVENEIITYLHDDPSLFSIGYRILKEFKDDEGVELVSVMVTALQLDIVETLLAAAKKAGLSPRRIDVWESARAKLMQNQKIMNYDTLESKKSFTLMDITQPPINVSVFTQGEYYANRYFDLDKEQLSQGDTQVNPEDSDRISSEIASIIDYTQYRERGTQINEVVVYGDIESQPALIQSVGEELGVPIISAASLVNSAVIKPSIRAKNVDITVYLDAYAATIVQPNDLDIKVYVEKKKYFVRLVLPSVLTIAVVLGSCFTLYTIMNDKKERLTVESDRLEASIQQFIISEADLKEITDSTDLLNAAISDVISFKYLGYPQAYEVLADIYDTVPEDTLIRQVDIINGEVKIVASTTTMHKIVYWETELQGKELTKNITSKVISITYVNQLGESRIVSVTVPANSSSSNVESNWDRLLAEKEVAFEFSIVLPKVNSR